MKLRHYQKGMSGFGWFAVIMIGVLLVTVVLKLFPIYMEGYTIKSVVQNLDDQGTLFHSGGEVKDVILKRLSINNVDRIKKKDIKITRTTVGYEVDISYEVRDHMMFNMDYVVVFKNIKEVRGS